MERHFRKQRWQTQIPGSRRVSYKTVRFWWEECVSRWGNGTDILVLRDPWVFSLPGF